MPNIVVAFLSALVLSPPPAGRAYSRLDRLPTDSEWGGLATTCRQARVPPDSGMILEMLETEREAGLPDAVRGLSLAAACIESGFNPMARGDRRGSHYRAHGILQLWPWAESLHGVDRDDPL